VNAAFALTPPRRRGIELLDDPRADSATALRSLVDIARCNHLFGGVSAVLAEVRPALEAARIDGRRVSLLDVGTGQGDIPLRVRQQAESIGVEVVTYGVEITQALAAASRSATGSAVVGSALALPFADRSIDLVVCSQVLHHFEEPDGRHLLVELHRVARQRVIVSEIRRSWAAAAGVWLASWPLGFHPVSRHDGVVSVLRGYRRAELVEAIERATGRKPEAHDRRGFRVTASWSPA